MKIKQLIQNIKKPKNLIYMIQGKYKRFIKKQYNKYFTQDSIDNMLFKTSQCPKCYQNGSCLECGCDFKELITTNKKCPNGKF